MKYVPPLCEGENASYRNFNPAKGEDGSIVPAEAIEHPQREIVNAIKAMGQEPDEKKLDQLAQIFLELKKKLGTKIVPVTQKEYDDLPESKLSDGICYLIYSGGGGG